MIVGKRIRLRAIEPEDLALMVKWRNDPKVYQYFYEHEPLSLHMQKAWFENFLRKTDEKTWIIEVIETGEHIGMVGITSIDWRNRRAEYGRLLIYPEKYHKGGYGAETEALVLRYVFDHMNMNRFECEVFVSNENVIGLHKASGFKIEGILRQYVFKNGHYQDVVQMAILREEFYSDEAQKRISRYLD